MPHRAISVRHRSRARALRRDMTDAETKIWQRLRAHRFMGLSFRRQLPVGPYIVDFVCLEARLIIEIDGGQHESDQAAYDAKRDAWLRSQGFRILRFWNNDVLKNLRGVLERVAEAVQEPLPPSLTLPRKGGGDAPSTPPDLSNSRDLTNARRDMR
ncbi:MAG: endonuclease domain-containing protein [Xanthobacteraceae bacterium]|nr:endonuclease domain-containing protein [Xanthobacteraceae bacterium]